MLAPTSKFISVIYMSVQIMCIYAAAEVETTHISTTYELWFQLPSTFSHGYLTISMFFLTQEKEQNTNLLAHSYRGSQIHQSN